MRVFHFLHQVLLFCHIHKVKREFVIMKKPMMVGLTSLLLLGGCGRPEHYVEQGRIDFSGAHETLMATFNQGVLIVAIKDNDNNRFRRFWLEPNISQSNEYDALFEPGHWKFYAVGYSGSSFSDGSLSYQCGYQGPTYINPGPNTISMTLSSCIASGDQKNDHLSNSQKVSEATICKTNFNSNFHCGP